MMINRIKGKLILVGFTSAVVTASGVSAQVANQGLSPASNTFRSFQDASLARDSGFNRPLELLNDFYPAITVEVTSHDNVRRRPDFNEPDVRIAVSPSLGYRTNIGRHQFYAAYTGTYTFHQDLKQENAESNALSAKLGLDLSRRWDLDVFASLGESFEQRGVSGGRQFNQFLNNGIESGPERVDFLSYGADLIFGRKIGVLTGVFGYEYNQSGFKSEDLFNGNDASNRDRESESLHLDLNWRFATKTSVFGRIQQTDTDYSLAQPNLDSRQTDYLLGLRFKPASTLSGVASIGRTQRDFDDSTRESFDGSTYYVNLNYAIQPFSTIELSASRFVEEPGDENADFYESEFIGAGWSHGITPKMVFNSYIKAVDDDYNSGREDKFIDWGVGLDYVWRNWLTAGIYYGDIERRSNLDGLDYDDRYFGIRLRSDLRSLLEGRGKKYREPSSFDYPKKTGSSQ